MIEIRHQKKYAGDTTQSAYNQIFEQKGLLQRDSFYLWLISTLKPVAGKVLLDISCGQGRLVTLSKKMGLISIGVDFAVEGLRVGKSNAADLSWLLGDGELLPIRSNSMDYVTHIGSLEHYLNPSAGAREIARVLKPDGKACILLPNAFGLWGNIKSVWQNGDVFDDGQPLQRYATLTVWQNLLTGAGLRIEKVLGYGEVDFPRTGQDVFWILSHPQKILRGMINCLTPKNLSSHFVFICEHE